MLSIECHSSFELTSAAFRSSDPQEIFQRGYMYQRKCLSESLGKFCRLSPAVPHVKSPQKVWMSWCENKAGDPPQDWPQARGSDVMFLTRNRNKNEKKQKSPVSICAVNNKHVISTEEFKCFILPLYPARPLTWVLNRFLCCYECVPVSSIWELSTQWIIFDVKEKNINSQHLRKKNTIVQYLGAVNIFLKPLK